MIVLHSIIEQREFTVGPSCILHELRQHFIKCVVVYLNLLDSEEGPMPPFRLMAAHFQYWPTKQMPAELPVEFYASSFGVGVWKFMKEETTFYSLGDCTDMMQVLTHKRFRAMVSECLEGEHLEMWKGLVKFIKGVVADKDSIQIKRV